MSKVQAIIWSGTEKFSYEAIHFIFGIIMARILSPSDYGTVSILMVFILFSNIFIEGGMTAALIQKKDKETCDYDTANFYNIIASIILYIILFFSAPLIEQFYNIENFSTLLRTLSLILIISSFSAVYYTRLTIEYEFKKIFLVSIISLLVSGIIGICLALNGYGARALIYQQLSSVFMRSFLLITLSSYKNSMNLSKKSFYSLFLFSNKLIASNVLARIYDNCYPLIIGKLFPLNILGFYSRGQQFSILSANIINDTFSRVAFPNMSEYQDDAKKLKECFIMYLKYSSYVIFPIMFLLIVIAKPLITILLTNKWVEAVPFMQILCLGYMFNCVCSINLNLLYAKGRSDLALKMEVIKKATALTILFISAFLGIWGICIGQALYGFVATVLNTIYAKRYIGLTYYDEFKIFGKIWIVSLISTFIPYILTLVLQNDFIRILIPAILYAIIYIIIVKYTCNADYNEVKQKTRIRNEKKKI